MDKNEISRDLLEKICDTYRTMANDSMRLNVDLWLDISKLYKHIVAAHICNENISFKYIESSLFKILSNRGEEYELISSQYHDNLLDNMVSNIIENTIK